ncbi:MAG: NAD(P)-binding domain-containing protein [Candidatus Rokuibacteriota bacterium]
MTPRRRDLLKIGIIGAGRIGGTLGEHWVKAGHEVMLSSRHPENLEPLADRLGPLARVGTPREPAAFGEIILKCVISHPVVTCAIPGTARPAYLIDNLGAAREPLPDEATRRRMAVLIDDA